MCSLPIKNRDKPNFVHILVYMILIDFINILYVYGFGHDEHVQTCSNMFKHPAGLEMGRVKTSFSCDWQEVNHAFRSVFFMFLCCS